jgi:hypothetical protein
VFQCYFDDVSKESQGERVLAIAAYIAVDEIWGRFQSLWSHLLVKHGLAEIREMALVGSQRGWDIGKISSILQEFVLAISAAPGLIGFGVAVDTNEWRKLSPKKTRLFGDAHDFCSLRIVYNIRDRLDEAGLGREQMALFFDRDTQNAARRLNFFKHLTGSSSPPMDSISIVSFADARQYYPLQAAHLLARETRRRMRSLTGIKDIETPDEFMAAWPNDGFDYLGEFWDRELIETELPKLEALAQQY